MMKWLLLLIIGICSGTTVTAQTEDSYAGYRIFISELHVYQKKPNWLRIGYVATNTGRLAVETSLKKPLEGLEINFDSSLDSARLTPFKSQLRTALRLSKIKLVPAERARRNYVKVYTNAATYGMEEELAAIEVTPEPPAKEVPLPAPSLITPSVNSDVEPVKEKTPVVAINEQLTERKTEPTTTKKEELALVDISKDMPKKKKKRKDKGGFTTNTTISEQTTAELVAEKESCADLILDSLKILGQSKRWLTLEYTVTNIGKGSARLLGKESHERDNVSIQAYMSGSPRLSRGAINIGGEFIRGGESVLAPGTSYIGKIKLDIRSQTRYTPVIILALDAFQAMRECDRTNNTTHLIVQ